MSLISAVRKDNGLKVVIPEHWLDHPVLGAAFKRRPSDPKAVSTKAATSTQAAPTKATTKKEN